MSAFSIAAFDAALSDVLVTVSWPGDPDIAAVDVLDLVVSGGVATDAIVLEHAIVLAGPWTVLDGPFDAGLQARTRRRADPGGAVLHSRHWRLRVANPAALAGRSISCAGLRFWAPFRAAAAGRVYGFSFSDDERYVLVASDRNVEVFRAGLRQASVPIPHTQEQLARLNRTQSLDTFLMFHPLVAPHRLFRQGGHDEWDSRPQPFQLSATTQFADATYLNGVNEVQELRFSGLAAGNLFAIALAGETTPDMSWTSAAAAATAIAQALRDLPAVAANNVQAVAIGADRVQITFTGDNGARDWPILAPFVRSGTGTIEPSSVTQGKPGGEPIMSVARGWPACGAFFQARLFLAGFASRPQTIMASALGDYFDFRQDRAPRPDGPREDTIDSDQVNAIRQIMPGRHLALFARQAEIVVFERAISGDQALTYTETTRRGVQHWIAPVDHDGALYFIQAGGQALIEWVYSDVEQSYVAEAVSVAASPLIAAPIDMTIRRASARSESDVLIVVNADGAAVGVTLMRSQDVRAFARWVTDGRIVAAGAEDRGQAYLLVERRDQAGMARLMVERLDPDAFCDGGRRVTGPASVITGLAHLEGREVELMVDGGFAGRAIVTGGQVSLPRPALTSAEAGLPMRPRLRTMPFRRDPGNGAPLGRHKRLVRADVSVEETVGLTLGANDRPLQPVRLDAEANPVTGIVSVDGLLGWSEGAQIELSQDHPGPWFIRGIAMEVDCT